MLKKRQMSSSVRYHRINSNEGDEYVDAQVRVGKKGKYVIKRTFQALADMFDWKNVIANKQYSIFYRHIN